MEHDASGVERAEGDPAASPMADWLELFASAPDALALPTDRPRVTARRRMAGRLRKRLAGLAEIRSTAGALGVSPTALLLGAFHATSRRWTGTEDFVVGAAITEGALLPMRFSAGLGTQPIGRFLGAVDASLSTALGRPAASFEHIARSVAAGPTGVDLRALTQVYFAFQQSGATQDGLAEQPFDLGLVLTVEHGVVEALWCYDEALFDVATIESFASAYATFTLAIGQDPQRPVDAVPLVAGDAPMVLRGPQRAGWPGFTIPAAFASQVQRRPAAAALTSDGQTLSYAQLDARSHQVAAVLRARGIGRESLVGLSLERGLDMVVGLLGILRAGAAYVPIDPTYPVDRRALMLEDSGARLALASQRTREGLAGMVDEVLVVSELDSLAAAELLDADGPVPTSAAYVIYTSGSTGRPKGVVIEHQQVGNFFAGMDEVLDPRDPDDGRWLAVTSISFDISILEIFWSLCRGLEVIVQPDGADADAPVQLIRQHGVSHFQCTPSQARLLVETPGIAEALAHLRYFLLGGEALPPDLATRIRAMVGGQVVNVYGPTETTIWSTAHPLVDDERHVMPLGTPLANQQLYILDALFRPVPRGAMGELFIAGKGVVRGYHQRPDLTRERFPPDMLDPSARMYRTGDVVRLRGDGQLIYLGRNDGQVKLRGHRIELGEVEARLRAHATVQEAVALVREDEPGDQQLVAYVVPRGEHEHFDVDELRAALDAVLPKSMRPNRYVILASLPLTPNGKIDRKALPRPEPGSVLHDGYVAPQTDLEQRLSGLWAEVLGVRRVGRHDDFVALGGHSLLAAQLVARVQRELGVKVSIRGLFDHPELADFARHVEQAEAQPARTSSPPLALRGGHPLASEAQARFYFLGAGGIAAYNLPLSVRLVGPVDTQRLGRAVDALVARHEVFRTRLVLHDGVLVQRVEEPFHVELEEVETGPLDCQRGDPALDEFASRPIDPRGFPLILGLHASSSDGSHALLLVLHHAIADGRTMGQLPAELAALYAGREPAVRRQYREATLVVEAAEVERQLRWWAERYARAPEVLALPTDRPRPAERSLSGRNVFSLLPSLAEMQPVTQALGVTPFVFLLGAFHAMCRRWTGIEDFVIGCPFALHEDPADAFGPKLNTLALRLPAGDPAQPLADFLTAVRDEVLGAFDCKEVPFERVVERVRQGGVDLNASTQTLFALNDAADLEGFAMGDLDAKHIRTEVRSSRLDFSVWLTPAGDCIEARWEYDSTLFDSTTLESVATAYGTFVRAALLDPMQPLDGVPLVHGGPLVIDGPTVELDEGFTIPRAFLEQVALRPDATAITSGGQRLSYGELELRSRAVAAELVGRGVRPESLVGLSLRRGVDMVVGLLGILRSGAAYVPVDPSYPAERRAVMLEDSGARVALGSRETHDELARMVEQAVVVSEVSGVLEGMHAGVEAQPSSAAYVIYTSGSTGRPKGVVVEHRNVGNFFAGMDQVLAQEGGEPGRFLAVTSISFDISVLEIFWSLCRGFEVIVQGDRDDPREAPAALMIRHDVTHFQCTPSQARLVLAEDRVADALHNLRVFLLGGEALPPDLGARVHELVGGRVVNVYGPTETTVWSSAYPLRGHEDHVMPLGRALANQRLYILDSALRPIPQGATGELFIAGKGVVRGYHERAELTAERFVPDLLDPSTRMYRTGDLVRLRGDGQLIFVGRNDGQVKLRGHRIELGEVEAQLRSLDAVYEAVAMVREDVPGDQQLVAYLVPRMAGVLDVADVQAAIERELPAQMHPNRYLLLDALPLTPNGKIDRKALPAPKARVRHEARLVPPGTNLEWKIAKAWKEVLGLPRVGLHDDFFAMGGHSLQLLALHHKLRLALGQDIPLNLLFAARTIAQQSGLVDANALDESAVVVSLRDEGSEPPIYCLLGVGLYYELAQALRYDAPVRSLYVPGEAAATRTGMDVAVAARRYYEVLKEHHGEGPLSLLGFCIGGALAFEVARLAEADGMALGSVVIVDAVVFARQRRNQRARARHLLTRVAEADPGGLARLAAKAGGRLQAGFVARLRAAGLVPDATLSPASPGDDEALARVMASYRPSGTLTAPVVLVGSADPSIYGTWQLTEQLGWEGALRGRVDTLTVQTGHMELLSGAGVAQLGERLGGVLRTSGSSVGSSALTGDR